MEKFAFYIGVDVSRNTLDVHCAELNKHITIPNRTEGFRMFHCLCRENGIDLKNAFVALEYTGGYEYRFIQHLHDKQISFARIPGIAIKHSLGITRGKSDKIDAKRIATYAEEKRRQLSPEKPVDKTIIAIKELLGLRKRLVRESAGYKATIKERKHMYGVGNKDFIVAVLLKKEAGNKRLIEKTEQQITLLVKENPAIHHSFKLLTSIKGIGKVNAWMTITYTENFTSFPNARSYAVYVGVIPVDYSSGTSIKGRKRVSHLANKELKQELSQAARSAIQWDTEMRLYAEKKLENKHYGIVVNNIRFKLILRMFAVIKRGEKYVDKYANVA